jgi:flagellar export protein FliJ
MGFRFSLEALLRVAQTQEECAERELQRTQASIIRQRDAIESLRVMRAHCHATLAAREAVEISSEELQLMAAEVTALGLRERDAELQLVRLQQQRHAQQEVFLAIRRKREVLVQLRTTRRAEYDRSCARKEQAMLDDLFLRRKR